MKSDYSLAEDHIMGVSENLSVKETVHIAVLLLDRAAAHCTNKRSKRMIEILSGDTERLEEDIHE